MTRHEEKMKELLGALQALDPEEAEYAVRATERDCVIIKTVVLSEVPFWAESSPEEREEYVEDCAAGILQEMLHEREAVRDSAKEGVREARAILRDAEQSLEVYETHGVRKLLKEYNR